MIVRKFITVFKSYLWFNLKTFHSKSTIQIEIQICKHNLNLFLFNYSADLLACLGCKLLSLIEKSSFLDSKILQVISNQTLGMEKTEAGVQLSANKDSGSHNETWNPFS